MEMSLKDFFGLDRQILPENDSVFRHFVQGVIFRAYPALQTLKVHAAVIGWLDEIFNRMAARSSIHSGYDGYDAIAEGYQAIIKYLIRYSADARETLDRLYVNLVEELGRNPDLFAKTSWVLVLDTGICCLDARTKTPAVLTWGTFDRIYLECGYAIFQRQDIPISPFYFPEDQFAKFNFDLGLSQRASVLNGIAKLSEQNGCKCEVVVDKALC